MALGIPRRSPSTSCAPSISGRKIFALIKRFNVGEIKAEEGMGPALSEKRNNLLVQAVIAKPSDFDKVFDQGMRDYLSSEDRPSSTSERPRWSSSRATRRMIRLCLRYS